MPLLCVGPCSVWVFRSHHLGLPGDPAQLGDHQGTRVILSAWCQIISLFCLLPTVFSLPHHRVPATAGSWGPGLRLLGQGSSRPQWGSSSGNPWAETPGWKELLCLHMAQLNDHGSPCPEVHHQVWVDSWTGRGFQDWVCFLVTARSTGEESLWRDTQGT